MKTANGNLAFSNFVLGIKVGVLDTDRKPKKPDTPKPERGFIENSARSEKPNATAAGDKPSELHPQFLSPQRINKLAPIPVSPI